MFAKVVTVVWYAGLALFFFKIGFPYLDPILGICAVCMLIVSL